MPREDTELSEEKYQTELSYYYQSCIIDLLYIFSSRVHTLYVLLVHCVSPAVAARAPQFRVPHFSTSISLSEPGEGMSKCEQANELLVEPVRGVRPSPCVLSFRLTWSCTL